MKTVATLANTKRTFHNLNLEKKAKHTVKVTKVEGKQEERVAGGMGYQ